MIGEVILRHVLLWFWRLEDKHIFKFQFANAFRPPTLRELNPPPNAEIIPLREESLDSTELSYIFRDANLSFRSTVFKTKVKDLIEFFLNPGSPPVYRNLGSLESTGIELEWKQKINRDLTLFANLSYTDSKDHMDPDQTLTGSVDWLANFGIDWNATAKSKHTFLLYAVGEQEGWEIQTNAPQTREFDGYYLLNYTFGLDDIFDISRLAIKLSVKNLTDENYRILPNPAKYPTGLPLGERTTLLALEYQF